MDAAAREQLLGRFSAYLDGLDEGATDDAAAATAEAATPDLFTLLAQLAALKNEVKIESRQVKGALDRFRDAFDLVRQAQTRLEEGQTQRAEAERRAREDQQRDLLLELLELRDRLQAAANQAHRYRPGWLIRWGGAAGFVAAMAAGLDMNLRRLDDLLARRGVQALRAIGQRFDPHTMHAAEIGRDPKQVTGVVLAEVRRGFVQGERLLRPAEVVVNRLTQSEP
ncbi:nucleotide exchange factor GrpE [uncultured Thiodictyon sp.]|uniref:nucleotide exchange factor GrpE n=1 Tax=uncultured Thiodictyon sp. TaxID=1846217 RepID=UPI0025EADE95|nr:nucleotide exchange factor GrpE [uncultured Thiodictyon sp.]